MNINKKIAVVTGGASGLGRAASQLLVDAGATVIIFDMNESAGEQAVAELGAGSSRYMQLDVSNGPDVESAFENILEEFGIDPESQKEKRKKKGKRNENY